MPRFILTPQEVTDIIAFLHDLNPCRKPSSDDAAMARCFAPMERSEEHTSELQSLMRISYAVFCLKKKKKKHTTRKTLQGIRQIRCTIRKKEYDKNTANR